MGIFCLNSGFPVLQSWLPFFKDRSPWKHLLQVRRSDQNLATVCNKVRSNKEIIDVFIDL